MNFWNKIFVDVIKHTAKNTMSKDTYEKFSTIFFIFGIIVLIGFIFGFLFVLYILSDGRPLFNA